MRDSTTFRGDEPTPPAKPAPAAPAKPVHEPGKLYEGDTLVHAPAADPRHAHGAAADPGHTHEAAPDPGRPHDPGGGKPHEGTRLAADELKPGPGPGPAPKPPA